VSYRFLLSLSQKENADPILGIPGSSVTEAGVVGRNANEVEEVLVSPTPDAVVDAAIRNDQLISILIPFGRIAEVVQNDPAELFGLLDGVESVIVQFRDVFIEHAFGGRRKGGRPTITAGLPPQTTIPRQVWLVDQNRMSTSASVTVVLVFEIWSKRHPTFSPAVSSSV